MSSSEEDEGKFKNDFEEDTDGSSDDGRSGPKSMFSIYKPYHVPNKRANNDSQQSNYPSEKMEDEGSKETASENPEDRLKRKAGVRPPVAPKPKHIRHQQEVKPTDTPDKEVVEVPKEEGVSEVAPVHENKERMPPAVAPKPQKNQKPIATGLQPQGVEKKDLETTAEVVEVLDDSNTTAEPLKDEAGDEEVTTDEIERECTSVPVESSVLMENDPGQVCIDKTKQGFQSNFTSYVMVDNESIEVAETMKSSFDKEDDISEEGESGEHHSSVVDDSFKTSHTDTDDDDDYEDSLDNLDTGDANNAADELLNESNQQTEETASTQDDTATSGELSLSFVVIGKGSVKSDTYKSISSSISEGALENHNALHVSSDPAVETKDGEYTNEDQHCSDKDIPSYDEDTNEKDMALGKGNSDERFSEEDINVCKGEEGLSMREKIHMFDNRGNGENVPKRASAKHCEEIRSPGEGKRLSVTEKIQMFNVKSEETAADTVNVQKDRNVGEPTGETIVSQPEQKFEISENLGTIESFPEDSQVKVDDQDNVIDDIQDSRTVDGYESYDVVDEKPASSVDTSGASLVESLEENGQEKQDGTPDLPPALPPKSEKVYESMKSMADDGPNQSYGTVPSQAQQYPNYTGYGPYAGAQMYPPTSMAQPYIYPYQQPQQAYPPMGNVPTSMPFANPYQQPRQPPAVYLDGQYQYVYTPMGYPQYAQGYTQSQETMTAQATSSLESAAPSEPTQAEASKETQRDKSPTLTKVDKHRAGRPHIEKRHQKTEKRQEQTPTRQERTQTMQEHTPVRQGGTKTPPEGKPTPKPRAKNQGTLRKEKEKSPLRKSPSSTSRLSKPSELRGRQKESSRKSMDLKPPTVGKEKSPLRKSPSSPSRLSAPSKRKESSKSSLNLTAAVGPLLTGQKKEKGLYMNIYLHLKCLTLYSMNIHI